MKITDSIKATVKQNIMVAVITATIVAIVIGFLVWLNKDNSISVKEEEQVEMSPTMVESIRDIGEWEFMSISDEELVSTTRKGIFSDDELSRIYYGTLRLGFNAKDLKITTTGDSAYVQMPKIRLLDDNFIDEARTRNFFESGSWTDAERAALYNKAKAAMKKRCLTKSNFNNAKENAQSELTNIIKSFGYEKVTIR